MTTPRYFVAIVRGTCCVSTREQLGGERSLRAGPSRGPSMREFGGLAELTSAA